MYFYKEMEMKYSLIRNSFLVATLIFPALSFSGEAKRIEETPALLEKGKISYTTNCLVCHGEKGDGNGPAGAVMNPKPRNFAKDKFKKGDSPEALFQMLTTGLEGTSMVSFAHLPEDERWGLAYYVLSLKKTK